MKQKQNRPTTRAPHGSPIYNKQFGFWCTEEMHRVIIAKGGSDAVRKALSRWLGVK